MKQTNHARDIKVTMLSSFDTLSSIVSAYNTWRTSNPSVIVPEGGIKIGGQYPSLALNSNRGIVGLSGATLAVLVTAYNDWKAANPTFYVLQENFAIDATAGAVTYNMVVSYVTGMNQFTTASMQACVEHYVNPEFKQ